MRAGLTRRSRVAREGQEDAETAQPARRNQIGSDWNEPETAGEDDKRDWRRVVDTTLQTKDGTRFKRSQKKKKRKDRVVVPAASRSRRRLYVASVLVVKAKSWLDDGLRRQR